MKPRALDLCCCQGGASAGLVAAGFEVLGVDLELQPLYPFEFMQADALSLSPEFLAGFDLVWASPHCQGYSKVKALARERPKQVEQFRAMLEEARGSKPWIMENVPGAPLRVTCSLSGADFGLTIKRERWFESNWLLMGPGGQFEGTPEVSMFGNFTGRARAAEIVGMPWANRYGLAQCVPPVYAEYLGRQVMRGLIA